MVVVIWWIIGITRASELQKMDLFDPSLGVGELGSGQSGMVWGSSGSELIGRLLVEWCLEKGQYT